jgi:hypothetical protein
VRQFQLIRREIREYLPDGALELLFAGADCVVEGDREGIAPPCDEAFASAMVTIDLEKSSRLFREPADAATARRVAELLHGHPRLRDKLVGLVADRLASLLETDAAALTIALDYKIRAEDVRILIDADVTGGRQLSAGKKRR